MGITVQRTKSEPLPPGPYVATIESVEQAEGKFGPQVKAKFLLEDAEVAGKTLTGWASLTFSPKSKLYGWARAAIFGGRDIPDSLAAFECETLIGRRVTLAVTTERGTDGEVYNKVKDVLPYKAAPRPTPRPAPAPQPAPDAQPPAVTTRAASATPAEPDWPDQDEASLLDPGPDYGAED